MPIKFNPDNIPRYDATFLRYVNENFQRLKQALEGGTSTHVGAQPPSPAFAGDLYLNENLKAVQVYDGTTWRTVGSYGELTWSPTLTQNVVINKTVNYARYWHNDNNVVEGEFLLTPTSNGTAGNIITVGPPVAPASSPGVVIGSGYVYSGSRIPVYIILLSGNFHFIDAARVSGAELIGQAASNFPGALSVGHSIHAQFKYKWA